MIKILFSTYWYHVFKGLAHDWEFPVDQ